MVDRKEEAAREELNDSTLQLQILQVMARLLERTAAVEHMAPDAVFKRHLAMKVLPEAPTKLYMNIQTGIRREEALPEGLVPSDLEEFADRSIKRLRTVHKSHLIMAWAVFVVLIGFVLSGAALFFMGRTTYAVVSSSSGIGGFVLMRWKWQPFDRATLALRVADCFDSHRLVFRRQLSDVETITNVGERMMQRHKVVAEFNKSISMC